MQPKLCSRCHKNVAVVFITKLDNNEPVNEGLCLKCARELGIKPVQDMMERMGISEEDLEGLTSEMMSAFGGPEAMEELMAASESDDEDDEGKTATFPYLGKLFSRNPPPEETGGEEVREEPHSRKDRKSGKKSKYLENYCISLTDKARAGKMDEIIGREEEIARVIQILNRRQKNNPCLIGEPGVGKTAIAEALAQRIVTGKVPYKLRDKQVYLLDLTALVAGTQFRGQFESRMKGLISEITKAGNIILVIDEVHNMVGAGDAEGSMNAANILKPALSRGEIQVIGATTFNEYRKYIEKDAALERRFQPVTVAEPSIDDAIKIIRGISHYYEEFHEVTIPDAVARQAVLMSERYITDRYLPDKAIDLIDEACSDVNLHNKNLALRAETEKEKADLEKEQELLSLQTSEADMQSAIQINENEKEQARVRQEIADLNQQCGEIEHDATLDEDERELRLNQKQAHIKQSQEQLADLQKKQKELQAQQDYRQYEQQAMLRSRILRMEELIEDLNGQPRPELTTENLANVIEQWTGIPASRIEESEFARLSKLDERLKAHIIGQDQAVEAVTAAIRRNRVGISPKHKPVSFIFVGATGVGKTELVKQLANDLFSTPDALIRLDMSEYMEKHAVSRLVGSPPGYVGYDEAGQLTEKIRRNPYSVILFDEIEKAHPDVLNILLQILDDGQVTDSHG
ncbi:MAG: AAA family ATPase, partial [Candidatus Onthomonas sp.]|nr:AAA family ATPase [Candidatus Onthomonas sp.]